MQLVNPVKGYIRERTHELDLFGGIMEDFKEWSEHLS